MNPTTAPNERDAMHGGALFLAILSLYWFAGSVFLSKPVASGDTRSAKPGVMDEFTGIQDCFSTNDSSAVIAQSLSLINEGNLSLTPKEIPQMMHWQIQGLEHIPPFSLPAIDDRLKSWIDSGTIHPIRASPEQHIRSAHPQIAPTREPNLYLSCFGVGGAVTSAPAFAAAQLWYGPLERHPDVLDRVAFAEGSVLVAASCLFLFLTLRRFLATTRSAVLVLAYGLGTCVFSTSSQGLWQHSATAFYLSIGLLCLTRLDRSPGFSILLGMTIAMATLSRPTLGIVAGAIAIHLLVTDRKNAIGYLLAGLPFAITLLAFNNYYLGNPFRFGQTVLVDHAFEKTGVASIWQTPPWIGLPGLLISPSRGLFVYSPFLLAAIPGGIMCWRGQRWAWLRPIAVAVPIIVLLESLHFDWWGGWSFGYRHLVDLSILLVALVGPATEKVFRRRWILPFSVAVAWSIFVQILGVTANDVVGWNARLAYRLRDAQNKDVGTTFDVQEYALWNDKQRRTPLVGDVIAMNIDEPKYRQRLWSIRDSQLVYCLRHFASGTASRQSQLLNARQGWNRKLAESYLLVARAYLSAAQPDLAMDCCQWALDAEPGNQQATLLFWELASKRYGVDNVARLLRQRRMDRPEDVAAAIYLAFVSVEQGDVESAIRAFEEALRRSPDEFQKRYDSVRRYFELRLNSNAVVRPAPAIRRDLSVVNAVLQRYQQGRAFEQAGRLDDALLAYREADKQWPGFVDTKAHLARILAAQNKTDESLDILRSTQHSD